MIELLHCDQAPGYDRAWHRKTVLINGTACQVATCAYYKGSFIPRVGCLKMRIVHAVIALVLLLFAAVQYNDPDYYFWGPVYALPGLVALFVAWSPRWLVAPLLRWASTIGLALAAVGTAHFWPRDPGFWQRDVWWQSEPAREGMGMMIVLLALVVMTVHAWRAMRSR